MQTEQQITHRINYLTLIQKTIITITNDITTSLSYQLRDELLSSIDQTIRLLGKLLVITRWLVRNPSIHEVDAYNVHYEKSIGKLHHIVTKIAMSENEIKKRVGFSYIHTAVKVLLEGVYKLPEIVSNEADFSSIMKMIERRLWRYFYVHQNEFQCDKFDITHGMMFIEVKNEFNCWITIQNPECIFTPNELKFCLVDVNFFLPNNSNKNGISSNGLNMNKNKLNQPNQMQQNEMKTISVINSIICQHSNQQNNMNHSNEIVIKEPIKYIISTLKSETKRLYFDSLLLSLDSQRIKLLFPNLKYNHIVNNMERKLQIFYWNNKVCLEYKMNLLTNEITIAHTRYKNNDCFDFHLSLENQLIKTAAMTAEGIDFEYRKMIGINKEKDKVDIFINKYTGKITLTSPYLPISLLNRLSFELSKEPFGENVRSIIDDIHIHTQYALMYSIAKIKHPQNQFVHVDDENMKKLKLRKKRFLCPQTLFNEKDQLDVCGFPFIMVETEKRLLCFSIGIQIGTTPQIIQHINQFNERNSIQYGFLLPRYRKTQPIICLRNGKQIDLSKMTEVNDPELNEFIITHMNYPPMVPNVPFLHSLGIEIKITIEGLSTLAGIEDVSLVFAIERIFNTQFPSFPLYLFLETAYDKYYSRLYNESYKTEIAKQFVAPFEMIKLPNQEEQKELEENSDLSYYITSKQFPITFAMKFSMTPTDIIILVNVGNVLKNCHIFKSSKEIEIDKNHQYLKFKTEKTNPEKDIDTIMSRVVRFIHLLAFVSLMEQNGKLSNIKHFTENKIVFEVFHIEFISTQFNTVEFVCRINQQYHTLSYAITFDFIEDKTIKPDGTPQIEIINNHKQSEQPTYMRKYSKHVSRLKETLYLLNTFLDYPDFFTLFKTSNMSYLHISIVDFSTLLITTTESHNQHILDIHSNTISCENTLFNDLSVEANCFLQQISVENHLNNMNHLPNHNNSNKQINHLLQLNHFNHNQLHQSNGIIPQNQVNPNQQNSTNETPMNFIISKHSIEEELQHSLVILRFELVRDKSKKINFYFEVNQKENEKQYFKGLIKETFETIPKEFTKIELQHIMKIIINTLHSLLIIEKVFANPQPKDKFVNEYYKFNKGNIFVKTPTKIIQPESSILLTFFQSGNTESITKYLKVKYENAFQSGQIDEAKSLIDIHYKCTQMKTNSYVMCLLDPLINLCFISFNKQDCVVYYDFMIQEIENVFVLFVYLYSNKENLYLKNYYLQFKLKISPNGFEMLTNSIENSVNMFNVDNLNMKRTIEEINAQKRMNIERFIQICMNNNSPISCQYLVDALQKHFGNISL